MLSRVKTFLSVTAIAVVIWLFAESESLGVDAIWVRLDLRAPSDQLIVQSLDGWDGRVLVQLRGSKSDLNRAKAALEPGIRVEPGVTPGVPNSDGTHDLQIAELLQSSPALARTGVSIEGTSPVTGKIRVTELVDISLPITIELDGLSAGGEVSVSPRTVPVRAPRTISDSLPEATAVIARLLPEQLAALPASGPVTLQVPLVLPDALRQAPDVRLLQPRATISFTIRAAISTASFPVPVQVLLPIPEQGRWIVELESGSEILTVRASGPVELIERLKSPQESIIAILSLSSDDLAAGISGKEIGFAILRSGVSTDVPGSLQLESDTRQVRFTIRRVEAP